MPKRKTQEEIEAYCASIGIKCLSRYISAKSPLWIECKDCGKPFQTTWDILTRSQNHSYKCKECAGYASPSETQVKSLLESKGSKLLSFDYKNNMSHFKFTCTNCGQPHSISWCEITQGLNPNFLCPDCFKHPKPKLSSLKEEALKCGVTIVSNRYINSRQYIKFICKCGNLGRLKWNDYQQGYNRDWLCPRCLRLKYMKPDRLEFADRQITSGGLHWYNTGRLFFNVKQNYQGLTVSGRERYSFHHIYPYSQYPMLRSCLTNGFPILYEEIHKQPKCGYSKTIHSIEWFNPESWNTDEFQTLHSNLYQLLKLPYHTYPNFRFWNLSRFLITETYLDDTPSNLIKDHQTYWEDKGRIFIPVHYSVYAIPSEREAFFQYLRDSLRPFVPEIDFYTGAKRYSI